MGQALIFNDDFVKNQPNKYAKIKQELVRINENFKTGKHNLPIRLSDHPIVTVPFEYRPKLKRSYGVYRKWAETELVFYDCLPGIDWVKAHYQDIIPEPTIELSVNGRTHKFNGNCKPGVVKQILKG